MPIWKIEDDKISMLEKIKPSPQLINQMKELVFTDPYILGDTMLIIGRDVRVPIGSHDPKGYVDAIAIDGVGSIIVIKFCRPDYDSTPALSDILMAVDAATSISKWGIEELEMMARDYYKDPSLDLITLYRRHFRYDGTDDYMCEINWGQRITLVSFTGKPELSEFWQSQQIKIKSLGLQFYQAGNKELYATGLHISGN